MLDHGALTIASGVSSTFGLLGLIAYFFYQQQVSKDERSIRSVVEGDALFNSEQVVAILKEFSDEPSRLQALIALTRHDETKAKAMLSRIEGAVDLSKFTQITSSNYRNASLISGIFFLALGSLALLLSQYTPPSHQSLTPEDRSKYTVYIHISSESQRNEAQALKDTLSSAGYDVATKIDLMGDATPNRADIRYFYEADLKAASDLKSLASHGSLKDISISSKAQDSAKGPKGDLYLYFARYPQDTPGNP